MMQKDASRICTSLFTSLSIHFMHMRLSIEKDSHKWIDNKT